MTGGEGADYFVLGGDVAYYNDGDETSAGLTDFAVITDFNGSEDMIQLSGSASDYVLGVSAPGMSGTGIYLDSNGDGSAGGADELIANVMGDSGFSLTDSSFSYI